MGEEKKERNFSDEDLKLLAKYTADELASRVTDNFHLNVGRGVMRVVWRVMVIGIILLAVYGAVDHKTAAIGASFQGNLPR